MNVKLTTQTVTVKNTNTLKNYFGLERSQTSLHCKKMNLFFYCLNVLIHSMKRRYICDESVLSVTTNNKI